MRVDGDPAVSIVDRRGAARAFGAPVIVEQPDDAHVIVRGYAVAPEVYAWDDIARVSVPEAATLSPWAAIGIGLGGIAAVAVPMLLLMP